MTIMTKLAPPLRVDCPRDRFKRPVIDGVTYQRVTTLAGMIDDTYALTNWKMRQVAKGVAWRDDIRIAVATTDDSDQAGKNALDELCERAMDASGASHGSAMGTAFHRVCQIAQAYPDVEVSAFCPPELRGELMAYTNLVAMHGLVMPVEYQERTGICPELGVAGTWDDLAAGGPSCGCGRFHVVDKKSGQREFEYGQGKVSAQLSIYARFTSLWLATGGGYEAPPEICPEVGYVISVPIGRAQDACVYPVDLVKGWARAQLAVEIRDARSVKRGLFGAPLVLPAVIGVTDPDDGEITVNGKPVKAAPKRTRRTKAQIAADTAEAERVAREKAHLDRITEADIIDATPPAPLDLSGDTVWPTSGDTGQPFLVNGELKPGPADVFPAADGTVPAIIEHTPENVAALLAGPVDAALDALDVAVVDAEEKAAAAVALLQDKLGAEVVRPSKEQFEAERVAALAGLKNGTDARAELAASGAVELPEYERHTLEAAIASATGTADLETAYTLWSAHWTPEHDHMAVRRLIAIADGEPALTGLWETYQSVWTDDLTAAGEARLRELARL